MGIGCYGFETGAMAQMLPTGTLQTSITRGRAALARILVLTLLVGFDQLRDLGASSYGLDQDNMMLVQEHAIGTVPLIAAPHQNAGYGLGLLVDLTLDVVHIGQLGKIRTGVHQLAVVKLAVVQQHGRVGRGDLRAFLPFAAITSG